jgi:hypothetical protein
MDNVALTINQAIIGAFSSHVIEFLKNTKFCPFINQESSGDWKRYFSLVVALLTTIGLTYSFEQESRNLIIHIPTFSQVFHSLYDFLKVLMFQQMTYKVTIKE